MFKRVNKLSGKLLLGMVYGGPIGFSIFFSLITFSTIALNYFQDGYVDLSKAFLPYKIRCDEVLFNYKGILYRKHFSTFCKMFFLVCHGVQNQQVDGFAHFLLIIYVAAPICIYFL